MGEFSEWYSTFLTDLPSGAVHLHRKKIASKGKAIEQARLGTPDYQAFIRDIHRVESMQRRKLHSLPELERGRDTPDGARRGRPNEPVTGTISSMSMPAIWSAVDATKCKPSLQGCKTFLNHCLNPNTRRLTAEVLVLDGLGDTLMGTSPEPWQEKKMFVSKRGQLDHPEVVSDDIVSWQQGLLEKSADGQAKMKQEEFRRYDVDCIDVGLTLLKAKKMVKLLHVRERMVGKLSEVRLGVTADLEAGIINSMSPLDHTHQSPDYVFENQKELFYGRKEFKRTMLLQACTKRAKKSLQVKEKGLINEETWKLDVQRKLEERQERAHRRLLQTKWLPGESWRTDKWVGVRRRRGCSPALPRATRYRSNQGDFFIFL